MPWKSKRRRRWTKKAGQLCGDISSATKDSFVLVLDVLTSQSRDGRVLQVLSNAMGPWLECDALYMAQNADQVID